MKAATVLPILLQSNHEVKSVVFAPFEPDLCVVMYSDEPPEVHCLHEAEVLDEYHRSRRHIPPTHPCWLDADSRLPIPFRTPADSAAFKPGDGPDSELSIVFGADDTYIHRFLPRAGERVGSIYFADSVRVAYNFDGKFLAGANTGGRVTIFNLDPAEPQEATSFEVRGGVTAMCFTPDGKWLRVGSNYNSLLSFPLCDGDGDTNMRHIFTPEGGRDVQGLKVLAMDADNLDQLMAVAGIGGEVWVTNCETGEGHSFTLPGFTRITGLQFVEERSELLVFGDGGLSIVKYSFQGSRPVFHPGQRMGCPTGMKLVGFHQFDDLLCTVLQMPE